MTKKSPTRHQGVPAFGVLYGAPGWAKTCNAQDWLMSETASPITPSPKNEKRNTGATVLRSNHQS